MILNRPALSLALSLLLLTGCEGQFGLNRVPDAPVAPTDEVEPPPVDAPGDGQADSPPEDETEWPPNEDEEGEPPVEEEEPPAEEEPPVEEEDPVDEDPAGEPPADDCTDTEDQIYVIDQDDSELYLFDPDTLSFDLLGELDCDWWGTPSSMAVARDGKLYVRYSGGEVYEVSLPSLDCTETSYADYDGFGPFGMGYATYGGSAWRDELYVANHHEVRALDTETWTTSTVATLPSQSELTGNAEGELWAFLPLESPAALKRIDADTGSLPETLRLPSFPPPIDIDTFAFATWGGDFYLFVRTYGMGNSTDVYRVDDSGSMTRVIERSGLNIVGAGVSTCAPTE